MNKTELIAEVSQISGVSPEDCQKVLKAFEKVAEKEISESAATFMKSLNPVNLFKDNKKQK